MLLPFSALPPGSASPPPIEARLTIENTPSIDDVGQRMILANDQAPTGTALSRKETPDSGRAPAQSIPSDAAQPAPRRPGLIPGPTIYYTISELTRRPQVIENIDYSSPELLIPGRSGRAVLALFISASGTVDRVQIDDSDFDQPTAASIGREFDRMRFSPGSKDGAPVACKLRIEVILNNQLHPQRD